MREFTLEIFEEQLTRQVVHMDQGVCYNPEFRATRRMHDYPSRKLQIARAVYKGELEPSEYAADIVFSAILSGQGERWQNFGEDPYEYTLVSMLCREMLLKKGVGTKYAKALLDLLKKNDGHIADVSEYASAWQEAMPVSGESGAYLCLDDATAALVPHCARGLGDLFRRRGMEFQGGIGPVFAGYEYFAYGLIDEGIAHLKGWVEALKSGGIDTVVTLSGQTETVFRLLMPAVGIAHGFRVKNVLDFLSPTRMPQPAYAYAGSFYARALRRDGVINALLPNKDERHAAWSGEFNPMLEADNRVNTVTKWQPPVCPEFAAPGLNEALLDRIREDAVAQIGLSGASLTVVFDPHAYHALHESGCRGRVAYFAELM